MTTPRHNVGWWVLDRFAYDHGFDSFERRGKRLQTVGAVGKRTIILVKPRTYMNRSGLALTTLWKTDGFATARDLLVVADDANLGRGPDPVPSRRRYGRPQGACAR